MNEIYNGTISNIIQNGAYVLLENDLEGFLSINNISWTRKIKNPSDILKKEESVKVVILDVSSKDKKISLGLKQTVDDPWNNIDDIFQVDLKVKGKVLTSIGGKIKKSLPKYQYMGIKLSISHLSGINVTVQ